MPPGVKKVRDINPPVCERGPAGVAAGPRANPDLDVAALRRSLERLEAVLGH